MTTSASAAPIDAEAQSRPRANRIGLWLFFASETFLFAALLSARFVTSGTSRPEEANQALAVGITAILLLSSISAYLAESAIASNKREQFLRYTRATIVLGLVFLVGVIFEFKEAHEFFPAGTIYGSAFFTLVGTHAFHVLTGIIALAVVLNLGHKGHFSAGSHWGVEGTIKYWHFIDLVWVVIYPTLYLF